MHSERDFLGLDALDKHGIRITIFDWINLRFEAQYKSSQIISDPRMT